MDLPITLLPHHVADLETADAMRPPVGGAGLIVGHDAAGAPVVVRVFDQQARSYVVVGGLRLLQLLVVRLVALSSRIVVHTERPGAWGGVVRTLAGGSGALTVTSERVPLPTAGPHRPAVLVVDSASAVAGAQPAGSPWSAVVAGYDSLSQWNADVLDQCDAAFVHQLSAAESALVERRMGVQGLRDSLQDGAAGMLGVVSRGSVVPAQVRLTGYERWVLGELER